MSFFLGAMDIVLIDFLKNINVYKANEMTMSSRHFPATTLGQNQTGSNHPPITVLA